jgi:hypothetical protein
MSPGFKMRWFHKLMLHIYSISEKKYTSKKKKYLEGEANAEQTLLCAQ